MCSNTTSSSRFGISAGQHHDHDDRVLTIRGSPVYRVPTVLVTAYWRRVLNGPRGELWFGAHSRAAPEEMHALARDLQKAMRDTGRQTPNLKRLLATPS